MFRLDHCWVWDFWLADDGRGYHLFFLFAPKTLGDPEARHVHAAIGHAVSPDLRRWSRVDDALAHGDPGQFDSLATWTGSVVRGPDGSWFLFYTGTAWTDRGLIQSIGYATSPDLMTWTKNPHNPVLIPDGQMYEAIDGNGHASAFRDPWVFRDDAENGWHMLITATAGHGETEDRAVVGHAWSGSLEHWELRRPLSDPGQGFRVLEVLQVEAIAGRPVLLFSCPPDETTAPIKTATPHGGVWAATATSTLGPYAIADAQQIVHDGRYSGRTIFSRSERRWVLLTFDRDVDSPTFCEISDPHPIRWQGDTITVSSPTSGTD